MPEPRKTARKTKVVHGQRIKRSVLPSGGAAVVRTSRQKKHLESALNSFPRITRTPGVMGGKPCIKGSRMTVGMIVGQIGEGATVKELLDDFPELDRDDILEAIRYAAWYSGDLLLDLDPAA
jgi:uncharacterized protein (DUF433 family)